MVHDVAFGEESSDDEPLFVEASKLVSVHRPLVDRLFPEDVWGEQIVAELHLRDSLDLQLMQFDGFELVVDVGEVLELARQPSALEQVLSRGLVGDEAVEVGEE